MKLKLIVVTLLFGSLLACIKSSTDNGSKNGSNGASPSLVSLSIAPAALKLSLDKTQQFTANGTYSDSSTKDLTSSATWTSSNSAVATVDNTGLTSAVSAGTTTITASSGSITGSAALTIRDIVLESPFGFHPPKIAHQGYTNNGYGDAQNIGVTWARMSTYLFWFLVQPAYSAPNRPPFPIQFGH